MQSRPHAPRASALVLAFALITSPVLATPAAAAKPTPSGSDLPGLVHGYFTEILSPTAPGPENGVHHPMDARSSDDGTSEEDDCDTDGSCGLDGGGIGSIMDPDG